MNENSPIWARLAETVSAEATGWPNSSTIANAAADLANSDDEQDDEHRQWLAEQDRRVEQHADRDEEQDGEGVLQAAGNRRRPGG